MAFYINSLTDFNHVIRFSNQDLVKMFGTLTHLAHMNRRKYLLLHVALHQAQQRSRNNFN